MIQDWDYQPAEKQWRFLKGDGTVTPDSEANRFVAYYDGRRLGAFINEQNALHAVEQAHVIATEGAGL